MKLFCFTIAGGSASFFNDLEELLESDISVIKLEYAGHGKRRKEPLYDSFAELAEDLYNKIYQILIECQNSAESYALMGYSMGSIAVIELLRKIIKSHELALPSHIFLAAHEPKTMDELELYNQINLDDYIKNRTLKFGGVPETLINNKSFWKVYLPIYRADYTIIGKYDFKMLDLRTSIPLTVFYSETDTRYSDMIEWKRYFIGKCEFINYEGNHFFIHKYCREIANIVKERLKN